MKAKRFTKRSALLNEGWDVKMNKQEIFNKVWNGFKSQDWKRSVDHAANCMYRDPSGFKCAVGHLIPDEEYSSEMEGSTVWSLVEEMNILSEGFQEELKEEMAFIGRLQTIHDFEALSHSLKYLLEELAKNHNLQIPSED